MGKIEFKSQICTTREQSERLLEMGLGKATADMMYITSVIDGLGKWLPEEYRHYRLEIGEYHKPIGKGMLHIPAWSMHRLIEIASDVQKIPISFVNWMHSDVRFDYDHLIDTIQWLIECGYINELYLEEKL